MERTLVVSIKYTEILLPYDFLYPYFQKIHKNDSFDLIYSVDEKTPFTTKAVPKIEPSKETPKTRKDVISKRSGVTKIGNNTYYYTGILMLICYINPNSEALKKKPTF